ncbi:MAG TPA: hypothetical protein VFG76_02645, partial [Candidatus Polarisedimenticolia bacterium]|nr:hypothetical protein [Candidatus Polarisedimenticolia bacterium]
LLGGPALARLLAESEVTAHLTRGALWLCPLACLALIPFQLCRPVFEGLQRGRPGLVMALSRYVLLTAPCGLAGMAVATRVGQPPLFGLLTGLIVASAVSSAIFLWWILRELRALQREAAERESHLPGKGSHPLPA